ncbi:phosphotransferase [Saxibacter everestensis]|uniref:Phosphotransferase n=1 Tax=Saxibacter everestensis TaxID=2909229 RepID=A0ABY8QNR5_9MICO|nr:phosphotransferase [Brevibacteriaceae bacterium ZFBP1038]
MSSVRELRPLRLPDDRWEPVIRGESGAEVFRSTDGRQFAKRVGAAEVAGLEAERDRLLWLCEAGAKVPRVVDWVAAPNQGGVLVTSAVGGIPADTLDAQSLLSAWPSISRAVRRFHELDPSACPFEIRVDWRYELAEDVVARGAVNAAFLPVGQQSTPPELLLAQLGERRAQGSGQQRMHRKVPRCRCRGFGMNSLL